MTDTDSPEFERLAEEVFELQKLGWLGAAMAKREDDLDLTESEVLTLDLLTQTESLTVGELQKSIGVLPAQMSRTIRNLESNLEKPLVRCSLNPTDKRKIDVSITKAGEKALAEYKRAKLATTMGVLAHLEPDDRAEFMRLLRLIRQKLAETHAIIQQ